jgi:hypothetical protein
MRACRSNANIDDGEVVMEIPLKCLITMEMGQETEVRYKDPTLVSFSV